MEQLIQLAADIGKLWGKYGSSYLTGIGNTLVLALVATAHRLPHRLCLRHSQHHSLRQERSSREAVLPEALIRAIVRIYVEVFRGTPMVLQAVFVYYGLPYFTDRARAV